MIRVFCILLLCLSASGCVNLKPRADTVQQYVLGPIDAQARTSVGEPVRGETIYVGRPDLPGYLEGNRLQYRVETGAVHRIAGARWGEPVEEGVARALSEYLIQNGAYAESGFYPWPRQSEAPRLRVRLHQFSATGEGVILVTAGWWIEGPEGTLAQGMFTADDQTWQPGNAESLVRGLNQALQGLADAIREQIQRVG